MMRHDGWGDTQFESGHWNSTFQFDGISYFILFMGILADIEEKSVSWLQTSGCSCSQAFLTTADSTLGDNEESWPRPGGYITLFPKPWQLQVITKTLSVGHIPHDFILGVSLHMNETSGRWIQSWMTMMCFHNHKEVLRCLSERVWAECHRTITNTESKAFFQTEVHVCCFYMIITFNRFGFLQFYYAFKESQAC